MDGIAPLAIKAMPLHFKSLDTLQMPPYTRENFVWRARMKRISSNSLLSVVARLMTIATLLLPAHAQLSTASVTGVVRDQSGSVVSAASLTLTNLDTQVKHQSLSNSAG